MSMHNDLNIAAHLPTANERYKRSVRAYAYGALDEVYGDRVIVCDIIGRDCSLLNSCDTMTEYLRARRPDTDPQWKRRPLNRRMRRLVYLAHKAAC
jgi:hypothetical protein